MKAVFLWKSTMCFMFPENACSKNVKLIGKRRKGTVGLSISFKHIGDFCLFSLPVHSLENNVYWKNYHSGHLFNFGNLMFNKYHPYASGVSFAGKHKYFPKNDLKKFRKYF